MRRSARRQTVRARCSVAPGAEREQVALQAAERFVYVGVRPPRPHDADERVQLVNLAVRIHAGIGLRHAGAVEQPGLAPVAGARVDFHSPILNVFQGQNPDA